MFIYLIIIALPVTCALLMSRDAYLRVSAFIIALFIGFRNDVGVDYPAYRDWYETEIHGDFALSYVEPGFTLLANLIKMMGFPAPALFLVAASMTMYFAYGAIRANEKNFLLAIVLFFIAGGYAFAINGVRQAIAAAVFLYAIRFLVDGRRARYAFFIIIAATFHYSALILLLLLVLPLHVRPKGVYYMLAYAFTAGVVAFFPVERLLSELASGLGFLPRRYVVLTESSDYMGQAVLSTGLGAIAKQVMIIMTLFFSGFYLKRENYTNVLYNLYFFYAVLTLVSLDVVIVARIAEYFAWSVFLFVPRLASEIKGGWRLLYLYLLLSGYLALFFAGAQNPAYKMIPYDSVLF